MHAFPFSGRNGIALVSPDPKEPCSERVGSISPDLAKGNYKRVSVESGVLEKSR
jgi:hypothetical protein